MSLYRYDLRLVQDANTDKLLKSPSAWRGDVLPVVDSAEQKEGWREERKRRTEFQLVARFLSDRSGPMVDFKIALDRLSCDGV